MSCGWALLKLSDDSGNPVPNRYAQKHITSPAQALCICVMCFINSQLAVTHTRVCVSCVCIGPMSFR